MSTPKKKGPQVKKCACDRDAVTTRFNQPVCERCLKLEHNMDWMHRATCGFREPENGNTLNTYRVCSGANYRDRDV